jgi:ubiquinol-cytochrome c reductase cytochrome c1 subunit
MRNFFRILAGVAVLTGGAAVGVASANEGGSTPLPELHWSFDGAFGTYDKAALQRGYKVYREVCSACHSMNRLYYRNLADLGYTEAEVKAIASTYTVQDGPNDEGEMFERPATAGDHFVSPFPNRAAPPDLSLIAKARHGGANYIFGLLTGYEEPPHDVTLLSGQNWNKYMPGHVIAMSPPLTADRVTYEDGSPQTVEQYAKDVSHFLMWASEPNLDLRKEMGVRAFLFMLALTLVMYAVKRKVWSKIKH